MMNTKKFLEKLGKKIEENYRDQDKVISIIKWYAYQCAISAREQRLKSDRREQEIARDRAYTYLAYLSGSMRTLERLDLISERELDGITNKILHYIWINKIR